MEKYTNGKIYKVVNTIDDKIYIGSTITRLSRRMGQHRYKHLKRTSKFYLHMQLLGVEHFKIILVKHCPSQTKDELEAEEFNIMQTFHPDILLNENTVYKKRSAAHVKKIADGNTGEKSVCFKFGSVFKRSGTDSEGYPIDAWCFSYLVHDPKKRTIRFQFSIKKFGDEEAKKLAEDKQKEIYPTME